jgi:hypothetical protein
VAQQPGWVPTGVNIERPSAARLYDYLLGGGHNFAADRALAERFLLAQPDAREIARLNRAFLRRAVLHMIDAGIRQFLDLGSGIPTVGNVHEIAQRADQECRVVYVDFEEVAVAHSRLMLKANDRAAIVQADMTKPHDVLDAPETRELLDFDQPIGLLAVGVFHFVFPEQDPLGVLAEYQKVMTSGSHIAISQFTNDLMPERMAGVVEVMKNSQNPMYPRTTAEITELFTGFEIVSPGVVPTSQWCPEWATDGGLDADRAGILAGIGTKP